MTAAVFRNTPSMSVPLTQNTAPVLEFTCLYTHDARKKQKKWQDGFLRYHTFNKRVMVYDMPRNFIGDMHWAGENAVQDGDELTLDRGGVVVEVGESVGQTETDLTELRKSKNKPTSALPQSQTPARKTQTATMQPASRHVARPNTQLKHKSLNALLGTPKGSIGKAQMPTRSPFEERHANIENEDWEDDRPTKRPRVRSVARTVERPKPVNQPEPAVRSRTTTSVNQRKRNADMFTHHGRIDMSDDAPQQNDFLPGFSDDVLGRSSSPPRQHTVTNGGTLEKPSSPALQVQQAAVSRSEGTAQTSSEKPASEKVVEKLPRLSANVLLEPSIDNTPSRLAQDAAKAASTRQRSRPNDDAQRPASSKTGQTLRLPSTGPKKRTLLCQDQILNRQTLSSTHTDGAPKSVPHGDDAPRQDDRPLTASGKLQARLAKIEAKKQTSRSPPVSAASRAKSGDTTRKAPAVIEIDSDDDLPDGPPMYLDHEEEAPRPQTSFETGGVRLARLDQRMLPPAAPRPAKPVARLPPTSPKSGNTQQPPPKGDRSLRRVLSESTVIPQSKPKRVPGAPVRYTPSPTRSSRGSTPASDNGSRPVTPVPAAAPEKAKPARPPRSPPDRTAYKKKGLLQKSVSLNLTSNGTSTVILSKPFQAPGQAAAAASKWHKPESPKDLGPWSREAFDLFTWRPPGWDEEKWCLDPAAKDSTAGATSSTGTGSAMPPPPPPPGLSGGAEFPAFGRPQV